MLNTPVLLITFNRPDHTKNVIDVLKIVKPKYLYIFQDGDRVENFEDKKKCSEVRTVLQEINWDCEMKKFYSETNLGCGKGPSSAISWFFSFIDEGIILEDDCVPIPFFFTFCENMLVKYRGMNQISFIGGTNFINEKYNKNLSYYFSSGHFGTWGWATWKRTWSKFDYFLNNNSFTDFKKMIRHYYSNYRIREYWFEIFLNVKKDRLKDTCWDYQFYFSTWKDNQLAIIPDQNLVKNIGSDVDATHTFGESLFLNRNVKDDFYVISHPGLIKQNKRNDNLLHKRFIQPHNFGLIGLKFLPFRVNKRIKKLFNFSGSWINLLRKKQ